MAGITYIHGGVDEGMQCCVPVCDRRAVKQGYFCDGHYKRWYDGRDLDSPIRKNSTHSMSLGEKFESYVDKSGDCWLWQGCTRKTRGLPYGRMGHKGQDYYAHRVSFYLANGRWPAKGLEVRHLCNNPTCVNPEHLAEGTHAENMQDAVAAGTHYSYFREMAS